MLNKKFIIVTGSSGGIGRALVRVFKDQNYLVIGIDTKTPIKKMCDYTLKIDLEKLLNNTYLKNTIKQIQAIIKNDILMGLINNAAVQIIKPTKNITLLDWQKSFAINVTAPFLLSKGLLSLLEKSRGSIVNIASIHAQLTKPGFVCYATSKTALVGLTKSMAIDLGGKIRINAICPAAIETEMLKSGFKKNKHNDIKALNLLHPVGRIGKPEEVAHLVYFLISKEAGFITGQTFGVDGGIGSRLLDVN